MAWFGKKVEIQVPDGNGGQKTVKVSQKEFDRWIAEGKMRLVDKVALVHVSDVMRPNYTTQWIIGENIDEETYERFKGKNGDLYVSIHYRGGKPETNIVSKTMWDQLMAIGRR